MPELDVFPAGVARAENDFYVARKKKYGLLLDSCKTARQQVVPYFVGIENWWGGAPDWGMAPLNGVSTHFTEKPFSLRVGNYKLAARNI